MNDMFSPKELACALSVSESTIKRWADEGKIQVMRTSGGHRRIAVAEAIRFIRQSGAPLSRPEALGLPARDASTEQWMSGTSDELLFDALVRGDGEQARGLVVAAYLTGRTFASLMDGPLRSAMSRIGALWEHDADGVFVEHRATDICMQIVNELRLLVPTPKENAPLAVGGALEGDPYIVPSLMAATVLADVGFRTINLGATTPYTALERAVAAHQPRLLWLSLSVVSLSEQHWPRVVEFAQSSAIKHTVIALGGRGMSPRPRDNPPFPPASHPLPDNVQPVESMAELAAFAKGLLKSR